MLCFFNLTVWLEGIVWIKALSLFRPADQMGKQLFPDRHIREKLQLRHVSSTARSRVDIAFFVFKEARIICCRYCFGYQTCELDSYNSFISWGIFIYLLLYDSITFFFRIWMLWAVIMCSLYKETSINVIKCCRNTKWKFDSLGRCEKSVQYLSNNVFFKYI